MRILSITIPDNKHLSVALTALYGVGVSRAKQVLDQVGVPYTTKAPQLTPEQEQQIRTIFETMNLEGNLRREVSQNVKRLKDIQSYRGARHSRNLPVNGQRTRTNSRTVRGNKRVTMGSGKIKVSKT